MCGIFSYIGPQDAVKISLQGLKRLEYRGYDSAGIAGLKGGELLSCKEVGKVSQLEQQVMAKKLELDLAIAHTRWATHGRPSVPNAHPQFDENDKLAVVHNGIIENYDLLRKHLKEKGVHFRSETDTEVIAQLIGFLYHGDIVQAVAEALPQLKGAFAIAIIHKDHPGLIIVAACESPLAIGIGKGETFVASDPHAFLQYSNEVIFLGDKEMAVITADEVKFFDSRYQPIIKKSQMLDLDSSEGMKGQFQHFMLKEIFEQVQTVRNAMLDRMDIQGGTAYFQELAPLLDKLVAAQNIMIVACGTSLHAGYIAAYLLEAMAGVSVQVEIASEFRYKKTVIRPDTVVIAISQSGETADTLAAVKELKQRGIKVIGLCNVQSSAIDRESDSCISLRAGPEIGVASTKAFTSQLVILLLISLLLARRKEKMSLEEGRKFLADLEILPEYIKMVLNQQNTIQEIAKKYCKLHDFIFLGRNLMFPTCLEGALKLKEIAYVNANGYTSGEMKHGPIALVNEECLIVALCANHHTYEKTVSNLMEVKARNGLILAIAFEGSENLIGIADSFIWLPKIRDELAAIPATVATQLFAYEFAKYKGTDIDQPRNLAKSVTVE